MCSMCSMCRGWPSEDWAMIRCRHKCTEEGPILDVQNGLTHWQVLTQLTRWTVMQLQAQVLIDEWLMQVLQVALWLSHFVLPWVVYQEQPLLTDEHVEQLCYFLHDHHQLLDQKTQCLLNLGKHVCMQHKYSIVSAVVIMIGNLIQCECYDGWQFFILILILNFNLILFVI